MHSLYPIPLTTPRVRVSTVIDILEGAERKTSVVQHRTVTKLRLKYLTADHDR